MNTLKDYTYKKKDANRFSNVRARARQAAKKRQQICCQCGYDKHVEVCHVKPIPSFPLDTPIEVINADENLILLCPNCHWEKDNLAKKIEKQKNTFCPLCNRKKLHDSGLCRPCANQNMKRWKKVEDRPQKEELEKLINEHPYEVIGKRYGVSGCMIKKWCRKAGILLPKRLGYWQSQKKLGLYSPPQ